MDDFEEGSKKDFIYKTDGREYRVKVEVEYGDFKNVEKGKPIRILLSLVATPADHEDKVETVLPIEAEATYRYKFGTIAVSMDVVTGDIAQNFQLTCSDGISKDGVQRGEPKWLKKTTKRVDN